MATLAARQAAFVLTRIFSSRPSAQAASHIHRRGLAGAADPHGPPKVNFWQDPMSPSKWKEEQFVVISISFWGLFFYGGYMLTGGKRKKEEKPVEEADGALLTRVYTRRRRDKGRGSAAMPHQVPHQQIKAHGIRWE